MKGGGTVVTAEEREKTQSRASFEVKTDERGSVTYEEKSFNTILKIWNVFFSYWSHVVWKTRQSVDVQKHLFTNKSMCNLNHYFRTKFFFIYKLVYNIYIYIYAFSRRFYPKRLTLHSSYSFYILSTLAFPGNQTHDLGVASAMLYQLSYRKAVYVYTFNIFIIFYLWI